MLPNLWISNLSSVNNTDEVLLLQSGPSPALIVLRTVYISLTTLAIVAVNSLTLIVMWRIRGAFPPGTTKLLMSSLALSDLSLGLACTVCIPLSVTNSWPLGDVSCTLMCSFLVLAGGISTLNIMNVTFDRLLAITRPLVYATLVTKKRMFAITVAQWIGTAVLVAVVMVTVKPRIEYNESAVLCLMEKHIDYLPIDATYLCASFIVPISTVMGIYVKLIHVSHLQARRINALDISRSSPRASSGKAVKLFCMISVVFTISWLPFCVLRVYGDLQPDHVPGWLDFVCAWLAVSNSYWNFIIYVALNGTFRKVAIEVLQCLIKR